MGRGRGRGKEKKATRQRQARGRTGALDHSHARALHLHCRVSQGKGEGRPVQGQSSIIIHRCANARQAARRDATKEGGSLGMSGVWPCLVWPVKNFAKFFSSLIRNLE